MHNFRRFLYGLMLYSIFSSVLTVPINATGSVQKNETTVTLPIIQNNNTSKPLSQITVEGGSSPEKVDLDKTHLGREHVTEKMNVSLPNIVDKVVNKTSSVTMVANSINNTSSSEVVKSKEKPVVENSQEIDLGVPKKNDNKKIVGKKGVTDYDATLITSPSAKINFTTNNSSSNPEIVSTTNPKKPKITEHDEAAVASDNSINNKSDGHTSKIPNLDTIFEKKSNRADYVIPIVAVILSVPLIAIIISVLYKRGTDWWQHRNYRRMDFLIEGMYNN